MPKKRFLVIAIIVVLMFSFFALFLLNEVSSSSPSAAQVVWQKTYGGTGDDRAFYALDNNQGYLVVGSTKSVSENTTMGWVVQTDFEGNVLWNKTYLQGLGTELRYALKLSDGYLLVGNEFLEGNFVNGLVTKTDKEGNLVWNKAISEKNVNKLFSAIPVPDGFVLLGSSSPNQNGKSVCLAIKIDLHGKILWNKEYLNETESVIRQGVLAPDGTYICAGYVKVNDYQFSLLKIDPNGRLLWNRTYGQGVSQKAYSINKATNGYIIVGDKTSLQTDSDAWVIKVDWNGALVWEKTIGGRYADSAAEVSPAKDGEYLVVGFTFSYGKGNRDVLLSKVSDEGDVLWSRTAGNVGYQEAYQVLDLGKNQYIVVGWTDPPNEPALIGKAHYDFYVAKLTL